MNTYVIGEIAMLLAITAVAGMLIGWCIKSLLSGRFEQRVRTNVARDIDQSAADVEHMRANLHKKDAELQSTMLELQQLRGRDVSLSAGNTTQVEEINDLKVELSRTRQTLDQNRSEFAAFRNEKLQELQSVSNELASFKTGGAIHDKNLNQVHDSIAAMRAAARENDKIIESLRARNKEADTTVENLRSQLKQSETSQHEAIAARQEQERASARLTAQLQESNAGLEKQKRDYTTMLETKNRDIATHMSRLEELGSVQSLLKQKEHDFDKLNTVMHETAKNTGSEINDLNRKLEISEQALADSRTGIKNLQDQLAELTRANKTQIERHQEAVAQLQDKHSVELLELRKVIENNRTELQSVQALKTRIENKDAEVVALNDMLRDVSGKRDQSVQQINQLESKLQGATDQQQKLEKSEQQMAALASALKQREADYTKLSSEKDTLETSRSTLATQVSDLQSQLSKLEKVNQEVELLRPQKQAADEAKSQIAGLQTVIGNHEREIKQLKSSAENAAEQNRLIANLQTTLKQKDAEVQKLRSTSDNLSALNTEVNSLGATIGKRDTDLSDARLRVKNLTASLKSRDEEIQSLRKNSEEQKRAQLEADRLTATLTQRDVELEALKTQMSSLAEERKNAALEIQQLKSAQATEKSRLQSSEAQRTEAYKKLQSEFDKISKVRDDYERRSRELQSQLDQQQKQFDEQLKQSQQKVTELQPQIGSLQTQISSLSSEKQQLTASLSDVETLKLRLTERDAEIRKLQIEVKEAGTNGPLQTSLQEQTRKVDSLTSAMRERDDEISRLNKIVTDNRVGSKQHSSEANLLKEEIEAQSKLIRSLEEQAENTLQLHKKIATQSTEIESLRADLHLSRSQTQATPSADYSQEIAQLRTSLAQKDAELRNVRASNTSTTDRRNTTRTVNTRVTTAQSADKPTTSDKPRLFVRHGENTDAIAASAQVAETRVTRTSAAAATASAENLAGTQMPAKPTNKASNAASGGSPQRALYTGDGYRLKRPDGIDDLALLPGFNNDLADALRKNDVREFEQVALWTQREVKHFADRLGISGAKAESLQWPHAAKEILAGRYRVDTHREAEKN